MATEPNNHASPTDLIGTIAAALKNNDVDSAIILAKSLAENTPPSPEGLKHVFTYLFAHSLRREAVDLFEPYLTTFAHDIDFNWCTALAYIGLYRYGKAEAHLRIVANAAKDFAPAQYLLGRALFKAGRNEEAIPYLRETIRISPDHTDALKLLSRALGETDDYVEANAILGRVASLAPGDTQIQDFARELKEIADTPAPAKEVIIRWPKAAKDFQDVPSVISKYVVGSFNTMGVGLRRGMTVFTQGSCFAGNLANSLQRYDLDIATLPCGEDHNSTFSNRLVVDWLANGVQDERSEIVADNLGREKRQAYLEKLHKTDIFVYTMGLAAAHFDRKTGEFVMSRATAFSRAALMKRAEFRTSTVQQNVDNLRHIIDVVRVLAPKAAIILTVSPVPLRLTTEFESAVIADCVSKSTLRVAMQEIMNLKLPRVLYWPSFEVVRWLGGHIGQVYGTDDGSPHHVDFRIINHIMDAFVDCFGDAELKATRQERSLDSVM